MARLAVAHRISDLNGNIMADKTIVLALAVLNPETGEVVRQQTIELDVDETEANGLLDHVGELTAAGRPAGKRARLVIAPRAYGIPEGMISLAYYRRMVTGTAPVAADRLLKAVAPRRALTAPRPDPRVGNRHRGDEDMAAIRERGEELGYKLRGKRGRIGADTLRRIEAGIPAGQAEPEARLLPEVPATPAAKPTKPVKTGPKKAPAKKAAAPKEDAPAAGRPNVAAGASSEGPATTAAPRAPRSARRGARQTAEARDTASAPRDGASNGQSDR